ncbi:putative ankyrin repeat domain-containing protein 50 [Rosellinia necatrix]|uniref:Putative ankyrin repeat domain-containing protein 50 n=1 Tax=Rosellinia necatrix TaxID=77044 RepID=A0A1S8AA12_ROSNE|nr:putative ankyrin repeat domain-containing protein 50 [Rosellinia necatrix]
MALSSNFSVCLTSRLIGGNLPSNITRLELEKYNTGDIEWAVQPRLRGSWEQRSVTVKRLVDKARGSFLWAQLATNFLNKFIDDGEAQSLVAQVLENLPTGLNELFEWTLGTLMPKEKADATTIMRWVMLSPEPMMLNDLQMAVRLSRTNFLLCRDPQSALDVGSPWSMQELQKTGKQFDTPSQFYQWLRSRTCGLLEARPADGESKAQQSLGLQRVYPINDSVRSFFMSGRGFAALSSGRATTTPPSHEAVDLCHYSLLRTILIYLNTSDLSPLVSGHRLPELRQGILSPEPSPAWRKNVVDQRNLVMSSYPFLRYAVDHLLYHLLSPRPLRYFLPQQAIFNTLAANDCRIWRRWTALLGETDALAVLAKCHSAQPLLRPEFGASFRLERVFRAVNKIAAGESWFSPHQSPGPPTSSTAPVSLAPRGEEEKTARQKPHTAPRPPSLPIASHTTRRGPRSRGTVVVTRRR